MKVQELIEELQKANPNSDVIIEHIDFDGEMEQHDIEQVTIVPDVILHAACT